MSPQRTHPPRHCPVPNCTWTVPTITTRPHASLKEHLMTSHKETKPSDYMTEAYCTKHGYHLCSRCDTTDTIYTSAGHLQNHITTKHSRKNTNITLVLNVFRHASPETQNNWKRSLDFLHNQHHDHSADRYGTTSKHPQGRNTSIHTTPLPTGPLRPPHSYTRLSSRTTTLPNGTPKQAPSGNSSS